MIAALPDVAGLDPTRQWLTMLAHTHITVNGTEWSPAQWLLDHGYHLQLREHLAATRPDMQSARESKPSGVYRAAERLFGPLNWLTREQAGLSGQPYVEGVALIQISEGTW